MDSRFGPCGYPVSLVNPKSINDRWSRERARRENIRGFNRWNKIARGNRNAANAALIKRAGKILTGFQERQK
jgi:hypothetical protein